METKGETFYRHRFRKGSDLTAIRDILNTTHSEDKQHTAAIIKWGNEGVDAKVTRLVVLRCLTALIGNKNLVNDVDESVVAFDAHGLDLGRVGLAAPHVGLLVALHGGDSDDLHLHADLLAVDGVE